MSGLIYLVHSNEQLVEMTEQPYDTEDLLQRLLAQYPSLIAGDQVNATTPRRWLLVRREMGLASEEAGTDRWSVDHLFLDQDGVPTIVEVKRSTDTRIRREVVGQMLDYAANAVVYWPVETIRGQFEARCALDGTDPTQVFAETLGAEVDETSFWLAVKTNLQAGRVRLVFVADTIPPELRRIIEYLGAQMDPTEVFGVEIKQYVGQGMQALVPRVVGTTAQPKPGVPTDLGRWDEHSFMRELGALMGERAVRTARSLLRWAEARDLVLRWGKGKQSGSCYLNIDDGSIKQWTIAIWTTGQVSVQFGNMATRPPFHDEALRLDLLNRLNAVPGIAFADSTISKYPSVQLDVVSDDDVLRQFKEVLDWIVTTSRRPADFGAAV